MDMAQKIKYHREKLGMTLEELGNKVGVGKSTVRKWETGMIANMRRDKISKIADALEVSPSYLMGWVENPDPDYPQTKLGKIEEEISKTRIADDLIADKDYLDDIVKSALDEFERAGGSKEELAKAIRLYTKLKTASPEIQTAIETLLKAK